MKLYGCLLIATAFFAISSHPTKSQTSRTATGDQSTEAEGFAIYLLAGDVSIADFRKTDLKRLVLRDRPVLTETDIIAYTRLTHELQISGAAFTRIEQIFPRFGTLHGLPFVVCLGRDPIYTGLFVSSTSSYMHGGVVILGPPLSWHKTIKLELGYPSEDGADPRADKRIMDRLDAQGKLN